MPQYHTHLLVLQPTPFCNIDCNYCYLPNRTNRKRMHVETAATAVRWLVREGLAPDHLSIAWHAGEPLAMPPGWYREAFGAIAEAAPRQAVRHAIQTNAMLINDVWCDLFREHDVQIGVSIDGPAKLHNAYRKTRNGSGTHAQAMRGIRHLRERGIPFHVIAVVTAATAQLGAASFIAFMEELGANEIGLNFEEVEGANGATSLDANGVTPEMRYFLTDLVANAARDCKFKLREMRGLTLSLRDPGFGTRDRNSENNPFQIVTIDVEGNIFTYSPELAGLRDARYGDFVLGSVYNDRLADIVASEPFLSLEHDIAEGVRRCRAECAYFALCMGGAPSNKIAELGEMSGTETVACRHYKQVVSDIILRQLEVDLSVRDTPRGTPFQS